VALPKWPTSCRPSCRPKYKADSGHNYAGRIDNINEKVAQAKIKIPMLKLSVLNYKARYIT